ncbi:MAG TPA: hypothetical protein VFC18_16105 [Burkholderiales bacterium]|nr:hypothetical protein [Burkholderiales bacterium]
MSFARRGRLSDAQKRAIWQRTESKLPAAPSNSPSVAEWLGEDDPLPPLAHRIRRTADGTPALPLEKHVLKAALKALRADPRVAFADRQQSGVFTEGERVIRVGAPGKLDVVGMLKSGQYIELEAKRPGQKPDARQSMRIAFIREHGGISGYFTSAAEAIALLP